jgi:hypothetical protein
MSVDVELIAREIKLLRKISKRTGTVTNIP